MGSVSGSFESELSERKNSLKLILKSSSYCVQVFFAHFSKFLVFLGKFASKFMSSLSVECYYMINFQAKLLL
jgi:hypothetical protein